MAYTSELNQNARIVGNGDANDEGEADEKARNFAEEADMSDFVLTEEKESRVLEHR